MFKPTPHTMRRAFQENRKIFGVFLSGPSPEIIEIASTLKDIEYFYVDGEHGMFDLQEVEACVRAAEAVDLPVIARAPDHMPETIQRYLDRGVRAIVASHMSDVATAERVAKACRYFPRGTRSFGSARANRYGFYEGERAAHMKALDDDMLVCATIEDIEGVKNLDALLKVDGIDAWSIGPSDLSMSLGYPGEFNHPKVKKVFDEVYAKIDASNKFNRDKYMVSIRDKIALRDGLKAAIEAS
ncbi:MAG: HpcH/HpaI aldolase family protein [Rhodospirillales bacterium]|jgi:2-keto-3-deoxy-L-rhamnonate aldolase RhmA